MQPKKHQIFKTNREIQRTGCTTIPIDTYGIVYQRKRDGVTLWVWVENFGGMYLDVKDISPIPDKLLPLMMNRHEFFREAVSKNFIRGKHQRS